MRSAQPDIAAGWNRANEVLRQAAHRHVVAHRIEHRVQLQLQTGFIPAARADLADVTVEQVWGGGVIRVQNHDVHRGHPQILDSAQAPSAAELVVGEHQRGIHVVARAIDGDAAETKRQEGVLHALVASGFVDVEVLKVVDLASAGGAEVEVVAEG